MCVRRLLRVPESLDWITFGVLGLCYNDRITSPYKDTSMLLMNFFPADQCHSFCILKCFFTDALVHNTESQFKNVEEDIRTRNGSTLSKYSYIPIYEGKNDCKLIFMDATPLTTKFQWKFIYLLHYVYRPIEHRIDLLYSNCIYYFTTCST